MGHQKTFLGYVGNESCFRIKDETTHKSVLPNGSILRTDKKGFFVQEWPDGTIQSWSGCKISGLNWVEEKWSRTYKHEYDYS